MPVSYSKQITDSKVMADALKKNLGQVTKIDEAFVNELEQLKTEVETLNTEQEELKANLKAKTAQLDEKMKLLIEKHSFAKKRVKLDIPQTQWKEYGIQDSK